VAVELVIVVLVAVVPVVAVFVVVQPVADNHSVGYLNT